MLNEFHEVVIRTKLKKYFPIANVDEFLVLFEKGELIQVTSSLNICRDPKDNFFLNLASYGEAGLLVTGDEDLLTLIKIGHKRIVIYSEFMSLTDGAA